MPASRSLKVSNVFIYRLKQICQFPKRQSQHPMNLNDLQCEEVARNDFQRLIQLCNSYGLNEEQTNQIIADFKNGSFACHEQSLDESFQQSLRGIDSRADHHEFYSKNQSGYAGSVIYREDDSKHVGQEYSFKTFQHREHLRDNQALSYENVCSPQGAHRESPSSCEYRQKQDQGDSSRLQQYSQVHNTNYTPNHNRNMARKHLYNPDPNPTQSYYNNISNTCELFLGIGSLIQTSMKEFQQTIQRQLEQENKRLKDELDKKEEKITMLMNLKTHDSEIIGGLKDSLAQLAECLAEKQSRCQQLAQQYDHLSKENQQLAWTIRAMEHNGKKIRPSHQTSSDSQECLHGHALRESQAINYIENESELHRKESHKQMKSPSVRNLRDLNMSKAHKRREELSYTPSNPNQQNIQQSNKQIPQDRHRMESDYKASQNSKRTGIDIGKYKGMIQKLRNSYEIK